MQGLNIRILYHRQSLTLIPSICIEPALCEVLTPGLGCRIGNRARYAAMDVAVTLALGMS